GVRTAYAYVIRKEVSYAFNCKEEEKSNIYKNLMKKPWLKSALVNYYAYNQTPYDTIAGYLQPNTYIISQEASTLYYLLYGERLEGAEKKALSKIKKGYRNARGFDTYIGDVNYYPFVTLTGCQYDGVVDLDSMISYQEVTLNVSSKWHKQEMICQFIVPPGSAVTKLSLWINGEERSGTVAVKEKAETAYNTIVSKQKDPAIITWLGENLYELKVFPVEPELPRKVRIGVTSPLSPGERGMSFKPVAILNGNFDIHENAKTSAIIDFRSYKDKFNLLSNSKNIHISALGKNEKRAEGNISGFIPAEFEIFIESPGKRPEILTSRSDNFIYLQIPFSPDFSKRKRSPVSVTYFLDSTHPMERDKFFDPGKKAIMESIKHLNPGDKFNIVAANFEVKKLFTVPQSPDVENLKQAGDFLSGLKAYGGIDIVPVMENNFFPAGYEEKPVFFGIIHSSHPLITGGGEYCLQKISRTPGITAGMILINYEENSFLTELINSSNGEILRVKDPANFEDAFYRLEKAILEEGKYKITCNCISSNKSLLPVPGEKFLLSPLNPVYIYMRIPQSKPVSGSISIQNTEGQELLRTFNINIKELSEKKATQNLEIKHAPREVSRDHIARLWAYNYILEGYHKDLKNSLSKQEFEDLIKLGRDYYMVTPYTAFIVLETEEQYKQFDIDRHYQGEMSAPSIPEPETVFIIITLLVFSGFIWYKSRRNAVVREM
ncbi:MAG TPA: VIT domain-containing protein, partial [Candidatus Eremiobacteraeota bacterium]|nr:VIT domain-containing protein [Candidatus Eremiobacteraeota bacterium]